MISEESIVSDPADVGFDVELLPLLVPRGSPRASVKSNLLPQPVTFVPAKCGLS